MYYLLNQTDQIIAADENLLALCGLSHIDELSSRIILGDTTFDIISEDKIIINNDKTYTISKTSLSSILGDLTLVNVEEADTIEISSDLSELLAEDNFLDELSISNTQEETKEEILPLDLDLDLISIKSKNDEEMSEDVFLLPEEDGTINPDDNKEILLDIEKVSQAIGISHEDYNTFLDEYIDTALGLEADLQSEEEEKRADAISTLSQLGDILHLPVIDTIIKKLSTVSQSSQKEIVTSFYTTLSRLTTQTAKKEEDTHLELFDMTFEKVDTNSFGTISLDGIKPIHFDFQLEEAANDLSLPIGLIEEFIQDFIQQAHIETKKMLEAYEKGDLDTIQKMGHLLKGASSNLHINALSDTLYRIQLCEDPNHMEALIKEYWGHFLSFEIQINATIK